MNQSVLGFLALLFCILLCCKVAVGSKRTVLTYNAGLYDGIGYGLIDPATVTPTRETRRDAIIQQLKKACADVVCLNEVWLAKDVYKITQDLEPIYRYSFSPVHDSSGQVPMKGFDTEPACPEATFILFGACIVNNSCSSGGTVDTFFACVLTNCAAEVGALPQECWACFIASIDIDGTANVFQRCSNALPGPYRNINSVGLLLLSRRPWRDLGYTDFHPDTREIYERGYLEAKVRGIGQVACAHLTSYNIGFYIEGELIATGVTSWEEQGQIEVNALVDAFKGTQPLFLLGDYNLDPGPPRGISSVQPDHFATLAQAFCVDEIGQCTYCTSPENKYTGNLQSEMIDYIFYRGYKPLRKKRMFDDVTLGDGFPLSDHFGVMQQFKPMRYRSRYHGYRHH